VDNAVEVEASVKHLLSYSSPLHENVDSVVYRRFSLLFMHHCRIHIELLSVGVSFCHMILIVASLWAGWVVCIGSTDYVVCSCRCCLKPSLTACWSLSLLHLFTHQVITGYYATMRLIFSLSQQGLLTSKDTLSLDLSITCYW